MKHKIPDQEVYASTDDSRLRSTPLSRFLAKLFMALLLLIGLLTSILVIIWLLFKILGMF